MLGVNIMSSASNPSIGLIFDIQALAQQNEFEAKEVQKEREQEKREEIIVDLSTQEDIDLTSKRDSGKDILTRRANVARAMINSASKNPKAAKSAQTKASTTTNSKAAKNALSEDDIKAFANVFKDLSAIKNRAQVENWPEFTFDAHKDNMLDKMLDRKNLIGCKLSDKALAKAKAKAKVISRNFRKMADQVFPKAADVVATALTNKGVNLTNTQTNQSQPNIDQSIFAAVMEALEVNESLQELGVNTEITEMGFQNESSTELLKEVKAQFAKNVHEVKKAHKHACLQTALKVLGDIVGGMFCFIGLPEVGLPILLAANGVIQKLIQDLAKAIGVPAYVVQSIIVVITAIVATACTLGADAPLTVSMCITTILFVAGLVGWVDNTIGVMATGQCDPSKFPGWVGWAGLGVNIGLVFVTAGESILNFVRSIGSALIKIGAWTADTLGDMASSISEVFSSFVNDSESLTSELGDIEMQDISSLEDSTVENAPVAEEGGVASSNPAPASGSPANAGASGETVIENASTGNGQVLEEGGSEGGSGQGGRGASNGSASASAAPRAASESSTAVAGDPTTLSSAALREEQTLELTVNEVDSQEIAPVNGPSAPASSSIASTATREIASDTRTVTQKFLDALRNTLTKLLEKLMAMKDALMGSSEDASELSGMLKGAQTNAEKAEQIMQQIEKVLQMLQKIARWTLLATQGAQAAVQFEVGRCELEIGKTLKEAAELTGDVTFLEQLNSSFGMMLKTAQNNEQQYGQDQASAIGILGDIIGNQRRNGMLLMSA